MDTPEIAIIEDSESSFRSLRAVLGSNYNVKWIQFKNDQLVMNDGENPHLYLLDLGLPDCEMGFHVLETLRRSNPHIPIIIITGYNDAKTAVRAMKLGANDYILKPIDPDSLLETVNKTIWQEGQIMEQQLSYSS